MSAPTLERLIALASHTSGVPVEKLSSRSALAQDIRMSGEDVRDFEDELALEFGDVIRDLPWHRFVQLNEGVSPLWPVFLIRQLLTWPVRGQFHYPSPYERLELGHIAAVIEKGQWFEP